MDDQSKSHRHGAAALLACSVALFAGCGSDDSGSEPTIGGTGSSAEEQAPVNVSATARGLPAAASDYCNGAGVSAADINRQINTLRIEWEQLSKRAEQDGLATDKLNREYEDIAERTALALDICDLDLSQKALEVNDQIIREGS